MGTRYLGQIMKYKTLLQSFATMYQNIGSGFLSTARPISVILRPYIDSFEI